MRTQVQEGHYTSREYASEKRFMSFWHQLDEARTLDPGNVLEIGMGNGFFSSMLRKEGKDVVTLDFDRRLSPDVVGTVMDMPFSDDSFDVVACFQVLEHLPYEYFASALAEIFRVARRGALISLPDDTPYVQLHFESWFGNIGPRLFTIPGFRRVHEFDGEHYWEIGKKEYPLERISRDMAKAGFKMTRTYRAQGHTYHRFFVLSK